MIQILCGNPDPTARCAALASVTPGASVVSAIGPALDIGNDEHFKRSRNYVTAGAAVKARDKLRQYTPDFGAINTLRSALITLA